MAATLGPPAPQVCPVGVAPGQRPPVFAGGGAADLPRRGGVLLSRGRSAAGPRPAGTVQGRDAGELRARGLAGTPFP